jgi:hypothetical protein
MLKGLRSRLAQSTDDLHAETLQERFRSSETSSIADAPDRGVARVRGEVASLQVVPRAGAKALQVTVDDGSGRAVVIFSGRTRVGGLDPGRPVQVDGMARRDGGRLVFLNPAYTLLG